MSGIELANVNKYFDKNHVLKNVNLKIEDGEFMTLLGPSGCGKTTTLRIISGLEDPEIGLLTIGGKNIVNGEDKFYTPPSKRGLNLVFQSYALWPHMTVFENVSFGLEQKKMKKAEIRLKVEDSLQRMQIKNLMNRYPSELSGGQQQRVAIARAIVTEPKVLLLDEPLSNLDAKLRIEMRTELKRLHRDLKTTIVYVTHDQEEALTLSTRISVFFDGEIVQSDTPQKLYRAPNDLRVAKFIGNPTINLIEETCSYKNNQLIINSILGDFFADGDENVSDNITLSVKPEDIKIYSEPIGNGVEAQVYSVLPAGSETLIQLRIGDQLLTAKEIGEVNYPLDSKVWITFSFNKINVYDNKTGKLIAKEVEEQTKKAQFA
ncbi:MULTISPECIES: ABC transporter ATP-binding protein [Oceanobacillus]|uniref:Sugar ABC transporter ATP-binding protein n=1 Tax=Oceanobacillus indicireducens TaxID=1004261 RepID=A0A918D2J8_9BACI|nr:ABC transporter ATP-binding protein [Oceanobacillus indicireducens]GGN59844.1 sugar ABC transporter ATP-binding protein [Oceanobacillus indicireducens]